MNKNVLPIDDIVITRSTNTKKQVLPIDDIVIKKGDSWSGLIGKAALKGLTSFADIPKLVGQGVEGAVNFGRRLEGSSAPYYDNEGKLTVDAKINPNTPQTNYSDYIPSTDEARKKIKQYAGIDLEPHPGNEDQRIAAHAAELGAGLGVFGLLGKGANLTSKGINAAKLTGTGAAIGGTSGILQEEGVNPLVADVASGIAIPFGMAGTKNLLNKFSPSHKNTVARNKAANALKTQIGEENLPNVLENIQAYKRTKKPINLMPTTPELAQDVGLSRLYRTQTNLSSIPARYKQNDEKLRQALESLGETGLDESVLGETIRSPFIERLGRKKERRSKLTKPLYEELESITDGLDVNPAKQLLQKEIEVASPGNKAPLEKYLNNLKRNEVSIEDLNRIKVLRNELKNIDTKYKSFSPDALVQIKGPIETELAQLEAMVNPRPIQVENTIQELGDKVNSLSRTGENNAARKYGNIKKSYEESLLKNPVGLKHREEYARLSKPINEIETSSLLNAFTKKNKDVKKLEGMVIPSEKIPEFILKSDLANTNILINKSKSDPEMLNLIKGVYITELLKKSTLNSGNFSYDKANKFINNKFMKEKLKSVFNSKERRKINQFLTTLEKRNNVETMGKVSGPDTHQKLKIDKEFSDSLGGMGKLVEKLAYKGAGIGGIGEMLINTSKDAYNRVKTAKYNNIVEEALLDPNYFKKLITEDVKPKTLKDFHPTLPGLILNTAIPNLKE